MPVTGQTEIEDVAAATATIAGSGVVVLLDEWTGTGDLVTAAQAVTAAQINFLAQHGGGLTSLALSASRVAALGLPPMSARWDQPRKPFAVSIEARTGVTTGISASDRARTIRVAVDPRSRPDDLITPGHVFPLRAHPDGLVACRGRTEAVLALVRLAGWQEGAVLTEVLDDDGELASPGALLALARRLRIPCLAIGALLRLSHRDGGNPVAADVEPARALRIVTSRRRPPPSCAGRSAPVPGGGWRVESIRLQPVRNDLLGPIQLPG